MFTNFSLWFKIVSITFILSINSFLNKKHRIYHALGEVTKDIENMSFPYKVKFVYYMFLAIFNLIKFVISATNMVSYNMWGDTNFFTNIIKIIGFY